MINFQEIIKNDINNGLNVADEYKAMSVVDIQKIATKKSLPFSVAILNVTGELNAGAIVRTAHNFGAEKVLIIGRRKTDRRSLVGCQNYTNIIRIEALNDDLTVNKEIFKNTMIEYNLCPIFIETGGEPLGSFDWKFTKNIHPCFILGNEGRGISNEILDLQNEFIGSKVVTIPMLGVMRSHNVSVASGIILWDYVSNTQVKK